MAMVSTYLVTEEYFLQCSTKTGPNPTDVLEFNIVSCDGHGIVVSCAVYYMFD